MLLIGNGPDYEKIQTLIKNHPYNDRIISYGESNNISELYDAMDLFLFPSKFEGLGIVLLEAQIKGLHCVASDVIPKEVTINKKMIDFVSLEQDAKKWGEIIIKNKKEIDRNKVYITNKVNIEKYDIYKNVKMLEKIYEESLKRKQ